MTDTVQLLVTCLVDSLFPEVGEAVIEVLTKVGMTVRFPREQTCCGQPAFNAGFRAEARAMAEQTLHIFSATGDPVVVPSGSCAAMLRHGYLELFHDNPDHLRQAEALAARTFELSEFLVDQCGLSDLGVIGDGRLLYHPSCHLLRTLGIDRQPLVLLESMKGVQVERLSAECCGFGGVFAIEQPELSSEMLERRLAQIRASGAEAVVAGDVSCLMHIEGGLRKSGSPVRCSHLAQVLTGRRAGLR